MCRTAPTPAGASAPGCSRPRTRRSATEWWALRTVTVPSVRGTPMPRRTSRTALLLGCAMSLALPTVATTQASPAAAAVTWTVTGPSAGSPTSAQVTLDNGVPSFAVLRGGTTVLSPSPIGIETAAADLTKNLTFTQRADQTVTETYAMTTGKKRSRQTVYTQTTLSFTGTGGARLDIVVRVSDTGAAYRYVLPGSGTVTVRREASSWTVPTTAPAWLVPTQSEDQG